MKYFLYGLTLLFVGLKLTNIIDWSWWLVLAPLIFQISMAILLVSIIVFWSSKK